MSRQELVAIKRRLWNGRIASVKEGKYAGSIAPLGYKKKKLHKQKGSTLEIVESEAKIIRLIFDWFVYGYPDENGNRVQYGSTRIARRLNEIGYTNKTGNAFTPRLIKQIVSNEVYIGKVRFQRHKGEVFIENGSVKKHIVANDDYILVDGLHEPIISEELFNKAKAIRENKTFANTVNLHKSLQNPLSGLFRCGMCGKNLHSRIHNHGMYSALFCPNPNCNCISSRTESLESNVLYGLKQWTENYSILVENTKSNFVDTSELEEHLSTATATLATLKKQLDKTYDMLEKDIYSDDEFVERSTKIKGSIETTSIQIAELEKTINSSNQNKNALETFKPKLMHIVEIYDSLPTNDDKNALLKEVIDHIDYIKEKGGKGYEDSYKLTMYPKLPMK